LDFGLGRGIGDVEGELGDVVGVVRRVIALILQADDQFVQAVELIAQFRR